MGTLSNFLNEEGGFVSSMELRLLAAQKNKSNFKEKGIKYGTKSRIKRGNTVFSRQRKES